MATFRVRFGICNSRLSNGLIESLNRKVKDIKRLGRGFQNFEHMRNRFFLLLARIQFTKIDELITEISHAKGIGHFAQSLYIS